MVIVQCKDGNLDLPDWVLTKILCRGLIANSKLWLSTHTKVQVWNEMNALANK